MIFKRWLELERLQAQVEMGSWMEAGIRSLYLDPQGKREKCPCWPVVPVHENNREALRLVCEFEEQEYCARFSQ